MEEQEMAEQIAHVLNTGPWKADAVWTEIEFTNERGETFRLTVDKVDGFDD